MNQYDKANGLTEKNGQDVGTSISQKQKHTGS